MHPSTLATVTAGTQNAMCIKNMGIVPIQTTFSSTDGRLDGVTDWTGYVPLVRTKGKVRFKLEMQALLIAKDNDAIEDIDSAMFRIILFEQPNNHWYYSGFRGAVGVGDGALSSTVGSGFLPQSAGYYKSSEKPQYNLPARVDMVVPEFGQALLSSTKAATAWCWGPHFQEGDEMLDHTWTATQIGNNCAYGGTQTQPNITTTPTTWQQGIPPPNTVATSSAGMNSVDLLAPNMAIPMAAEFKVIKEHWFHFTAGSNTSASHTWEWTEHFDYAQDDAQLWQLGIDPNQTNFVPMTEQRYLTAQHYIRSGSGSLATDPTGSLFFTITVDIE